MATSSRAQDGGVGDECAVEARPPMPAWKPEKGRSDDRGAHTPPHRHRRAQRFPAGVTGQHQAHRGRHAANVVAGRRQAGLDGCAPGAMPVSPPCSTPFARS